MRPLVLSISVIAVLLKVEWRAPSSRWSRLPKAPQPGASAEVVEFSLAQPIEAWSSASQDDLPEIDEQERQQLRSDRRF
jgi:hypothetical protein